MLFISDTTIILLTVEEEKVKGPQEDHQDQPLKMLKINLLGWKALKEERERVARECTGIQVKAKLKKVK